MSQYCTVTDVEAYYQGKSFKIGDYITDDEIDSYILAQSAIIDATLTSHYNLPITSAADLLILKTICEKLVVGIIDDITREKTEDGKFERGRNTTKEAEKLLKMIDCGQMKLAAGQKGSVITFNRTTSDGETVEKRFKDSNIEPVVTTIDRERRRIVG